MRNPNLEPFEAQNDLFLNIFLTSGQFENGKITNFNYTNHISTKEIKNYKNLDFSKNNSEKPTILVIFAKFRPNLGQFWP